MSARVRRIGIGIAEDAQKVIDSANSVSGEFHDGLLLPAGDG